MHSWSQESGIFPFWVVMARLSCSSRKNRGRCSNINMRVSSDTTNGSLHLDRVRAVAALVFLFFFIIALVFQTVFSSRKNLDFDTVAHFVVI